MQFGLHDINSCEPAFIEVENVARQQPVRHWLLGLVERRHRTDQGGRGVEECVGGIVFELGYAGSDVSHFCVLVVGGGCSGSGGYIGWWREGCHSMAGGNWGNARTGRHSKRGSGR